MQIVVERIINEQLLENILFSKSHMPVTNENSMIPTRDNDNLKNLNCENNQLDNVNVIFSIQLYCNIYVYNVYVNYISNLNYLFLEILVSIA